MCAVQVRSTEKITQRYLKLLTLSTWGLTDYKRSVGLLLSLPEVHNQLFSFAHVQRETVVLAPWCKSLYLIQVCGLIIVRNKAQNHSIISEFDDGCGAVRAHAVVCVERVEQGAQDTALWGSYVQGDGVWGELAYFHHLRSAGEEILDPVTVKSLGRGLWVLKLSWWGLLYWKLSCSQWIAVLHSSHFCCQCVWGNSKNTVHRAPFVRFKSSTCFDHLTIPFPKFLKVNFLYCIGGSMKNV